MYVCLARTNIHKFLAHSFLVASSFDLSAKKRGQIPAEKQL